MTQHHENCLLLFVKYPEKGQVKHRLSVDLDEQLVQELYRCFVQDTLATVNTMSPEVFICFLPVNAESKFRGWLGTSHPFLPQEGADLGERMKNCFSQVFARGFQQAILMGSDSPDIPATFLHNAFAELRRHEVVIGPSSDGGYYLIGFQSTSFDPSVFEDIPWSSPTVLRETLRKIKQKNHRVSLLPAWSDVDTIADLKNLWRRNKNTAFKSSKTITFLRQNKILAEVDDDAKPKK